MATGVKFSIITVSRNAAGHIAECLASVARQTYEHAEHIIVDGASTDGTQKIVARHNQRVSKFISEPDAGIYDAMNKGVHLASGDYVLFLGADDFLFDPQVLDDIAALIAREDRPDLIYGDIEVRQTDGHRVISRPPPPAEALAFMICGCLPHQATFAERSLFLDRVGLFDTRYRVQADYDWFLRALGTPNLQIRHVNRIVSSFRLGGTSSLLRRGQEETFAIQNAFPIYRQPEWVERRLYEFQKHLLDYRIQLQEILAAQPRLARPSFFRKVIRKLRRTFVASQT